MTVQFGSTIRIPIQDAAVARDLSMRMVRESRHYSQEGSISMVGREMFIDVDNPALVVLNNRPDNEHANALGDVKQALDWLKRNLKDLPEQYVYSLTVSMQNAFADKTAIMTESRKNPTLFQRVFSRKQ